MVIGNDDAHIHTLGDEDKMSFTKELMLAINAVTAGRIYLSEHTKKQISECSASGVETL